MNQHTPGRLTLERVESDSGTIRHLCPVDKDGLSVLTVVEHEGVKFAAVYLDDDAHRLVDCWNALVDLPQAALDGGWTRAGLEAYGNSMKAQRDELLKALKDLLDLVEVITPMEGDTVRKARAAIAKATGEHP